MSFNFWRCAKTHLKHLKGNTENDIKMVLKRHASRNGRAQCATWGGFSESHECFIKSQVLSLVVPFLFPEPICWFSAQQHSELRIALGKYTCWVHFSHRGNRGTRISELFMIVDDINNGPSFSWLIINLVQCYKKKKGHLECRHNSCFTRRNSSFLWFTFLSWTFQVLTHFSTFLLFSITLFSRKSLRFSLSLG